MDEQENNLTGGPLASPALGSRPPEPPARSGPASSGWACARLTTGDGSAASGVTSSASAGAPVSIASAERAESSCCATAARSASAWARKATARARSASKASPFWLRSRTSRSVSRACSRESSA